MSISDVFIGSRRVRGSSSHEPNAASTSADEPVDGSTRRSCWWDRRRRGSIPTPASRRVLRRRERTEVRVPDQQLQSACVDDRKTLQVSMAGRAVFQMDQIEFVYQILLRHERQRRENSSVDRDQRLRARGHRQEGTRGRPQPQRNFANPQPDALREKPSFSGVERVKTARSGTAFP
jgi:hypothetical protein